MTFNASTSFVCAVDVALDDMEVRDAETGERILVTLSPGKRAKLPLALPPPSCTLPPIGSGIPKPLAATQPGAHQQQSANHATAAARNGEAAETRVVFPETQSTRHMGALVDWSKDQQSRVERAEERFRMSIQGLRRELQRKDLSFDARQAIEVQILEKMKTEYGEQLHVMVLEEMKRELARDVDYRLELSVLGKERLRKRHEKDRAFYKAQIERVRKECELSLVATMAQYNLLR